MANVNGNVLMTIIKVLAAIAGFASIIVGSTYMNHGFSNNFNGNLLFGGFFLFLAGLLVILMEISSCLQCSNSFQIAIVKIYAAPLWVRGIVYILSVIPTLIMIRGNDVIFSCVLMILTGGFYIILSFFVSNAPASAPARSPPTQTA